MATSISNFSNSTSYDGLLRNVYLPYIIDTTYNDHSLADMIETRTDMTPGGGNYIVNQFVTQRSEGVGAFSEGGNWVSSVPVKGKQATENVKFLNAYFSLNGPLVKAANSSQKSAVDAVTAHFDSIIVAWKNNFDRMLIGDGSGRLAYVSSISSDDVTLTNTGFLLAPYNADQFVPIGTRLNIATFDSSGVVSSGFCNSNSDDSYIFIADSLTSRSAANGTAVIGMTDEDGTAYAAGGTTDIAANDYLVRQNAYGTPSTSSAAFSTCLEINGLSNLVSDGTNNSETTSNYTSVWGQTRTNFSYLMSHTSDFSAELDEDNLLGFVMDVQYSVQGMPNVLVCTPKAQLKYFTNTLQPDRRFNGVQKEVEAGYTNTYIQLGDRRYRLIPKGQCPSGVMFAINTEDFKFAQNAPFDWVLGDGGNILQQSHSSDTKFASAVQYMNLVCLDPGRQAKGYSITES